MKKAIVIGASSGIGMELAKILVEKGYYVAVTARRFNLLMNIFSEFPGSVIPFEQDISKTEKLAGELESLVQKLGGLDLLVISAGTGDLNEKLDFAIEESTVAVNILGFTAIACWAFNYFRKQGNGHIVAVTSVAGLRGNRSAPSYNASKAYQINFFEGLRQKARDLKVSIQITDIRPGFVDTEMAKGETKFWLASPKKAAKQIYHAVLKRKNVVYITRRWVIIAVMFKILPRRLYERL